MGLQKSEKMLGLFSLRRTKYKEIFMKILWFSLAMSVFVFVGCSSMLNGSQENNVSFGPYPTNYVELVHECFKTGLYVHPKVDPNNFQFLEIDPPQKSTVPRIVLYSKYSKNAYWTVRVVLGSVELRRNTYFPYMTYWVDIYNGEVFRAYIPFEQDYSR
jgi:hypothetical protein